MKKILVDELIYTDFASVSKEECVSIIKYLYNVSKTLEALNKDQADMLATVKEMRKLAASKRYTASTEYLPLLFDETEIYTQFGLGEVGEDMELVKEHERKKRTPQSVLPASTPVCVCDHTEGAVSSYVKDDVTYERIEDTVVNQVAYTPASCVIEKHIYPAYKATVEMEDAKKQKEVQFENPETDKLSVSAAFASNIVISKFSDHLPLYRQEQIYARIGLIFSRQKMAKCLITYYSSLMSFATFYEKQIFKMNLVQQDETPVQVLDIKNKNGKVSSNCFAIIRVGTDLIEGKPRRLCSLYFSEGRSTDKLLDEYRKSKYPGIVMTDGLKGYLKIEDEHHAVCWVHAIRRFKEVLKMDKKNKHAFAACTKAGELFTIDKQYRALLENGQLTEAEFLAKRKEASLPVIEEFLNGCEKTSEIYPKDSAMGKAFTYIENYKHLLPNYLDNAACTPDNNACERIAKDFAKGRGNWLFSQTVDGVDASCFYYSLIESAKANKIPTDLYVEHILTFGRLAKTDEEYEALLPWNVDLTKTIERRALRASAAPDQNRDKPYTLTGFSR